MFLARIPRLCSRDGALVGKHVPTQLERSTKQHQIRRTWGIAIRLHGIDHSESSHRPLPRAGKDSPGCLKGPEEGGHYWAHVPPSLFSSCFLVALCRLGGCALLLGSSEGRYLGKLLGQVCRLRSCNAGKKKQKKTKGRQAGRRLRRHAAMDKRDMSLWLPACRYTSPVHSDGCDSIPGCSGLLVSCSTDIARRDAKMSISIDGLESQVMILETPRPLCVPDPGNRDCLVYRIKDMDLRWCWT